MKEKRTNDDNDSWNDNYDTDNSNFGDNDEQNDQKNIQIIQFLTPTGALIVTVDYFCI